MSHLRVFAQNRGNADEGVIRAGPSALTGVVTTYQPTEVIAFNGWVLGRPDCAHVDASANELRGEVAKWRSS